MITTMYTYATLLESMDNAGVSYKITQEYQLDTSVVALEILLPEGKAEVLGFVDGSQIRRRFSIPVKPIAFRQEWEDEVTRALQSVSSETERMFAIRPQNAWHVFCIRATELPKAVGFRAAEAYVRLADLMRTSQDLKQRIVEISKRNPRFGEPTPQGKFANAIKYMALAFEEIAANGYTSKADAKPPFESTAASTNRRYSSGEEPEFDALIRTCAARAWFRNNVPKMEGKEYFDSEVRAILDDATDHNVFLLREQLDKVLWIEKWYLDYLSQSMEKKTLEETSGISATVREYTVGEKIDVSAAYVDVAMSRTKFSKEGETNYRYQFILDGGVRATWKTRVYILRLGQRDLNKGDKLVVRAKVKEIKVNPKNGEHEIVLTYAKVFRPGDEPAAKVVTKKTTKTAKRTTKSTKTAKRTTRTTTARKPATRVAKPAAKAPTKRTTAKRTPKTAGAKRTGKRTAA